MVTTVRRQCRQPSRAEGPRRIDRFAEWYYVYQQIWGIQEWDERAAAVIGRALLSQQKLLIGGYREVR